jgi:hypothetical protein
MKFTFKTTKPTGRYASFDHPYHQIKLKKISCGSIDPDIPFTIRLQVMKSEPDENPNCPWKWIVFQKKSETLQEAKDFLNAHIKEIQSKYKIYLSE